MQTAFVRLLAIAALVAATVCRADDDPPDLAKARAIYQKEVEFVTRPVTERYVRALDQLKRSLGARGDARGAFAVQKEIDRVDPYSMLARFAGKWNFHYSNNTSHVYTIDSAGGITWLETDGARIAPKKGKIVLQGQDFIVEWHGLDRIERISLSDGGLQIEHFNKGDYPQGTPGLKATGTLVTGR